MASFQQDVPSIPIVPPAMTQQMGNDIQNQAAALRGHVPMEKHFPLVALSYATSRRPEHDAKGVGPGMYYALHMMMLLQRVGHLSSISGLSINSAEDWKIFLLRLIGFDARAVVLIVIQTSALYRSKPCLLEIEAAIDAGMTIIPVRYEDNLPPPRQQWTAEHLSKDGKVSTSDQLTRIKVLKHFSPLNSLPPNGTVFNDPTSFQKLIIRVQQAIRESEQVETQQESPVKKESSSSPFPPDIVAMFSPLKLKETTSNNLMSHLCDKQECADVSEVRSLLLKDSKAPEIIKTILPPSKHEKFNNMLTTMKNQGGAEEPEVIQPVSPVMSKEELLVSVLAKNNKLNEADEIQFNKTPSHKAANNNDVKTLKALIKFKANLESQDEVRITHNKFNPPFFCLL